MPVNGEILHGKASSQGNIFTVDVEEYYQVEAFSTVIDESKWNQYPDRVDKNIDTILTILQPFDVSSTFFVVGLVAEKFPALVKKISDHGHEVASHGYTHKMITGHTPTEFRKDIAKSKDILEQITGKRVHGYRAPTFSISSNNSWVYDVLLQEGFRYSSSVFPIKHDRYGWPEFGFRPKKMAWDRNGDLWELPLSVSSLGPIKIPFGGGGYLRLYPLNLTVSLFRRQNRNGYPGIVYVHPWEIDRHHPKINAPFFRKWRHYIGISRMQSKLEYLLRYFTFMKMEDYLEKIKLDA